MGATDDEPPCTAVVADGEAPPNVLFTPPCSCPRCRPQEFFDHHSRPTEGWLRLPGRPQRLRVEVVALGSAGRAMLG